MRKTAVCITLIALTGFASCAYFNTFYNARRYYRKGYEETRKNRTDRVTSAETQNYQKVIEKCAKLIQEYPDSKWVDDAIMLMGKAYFYQQQYMRSNRKFVELLANYPKSPYAPEARLWLARTNISLEKYSDAEQELKFLVRQDIKKELIAEAHFYLGQLHNRQKDYLKAVEAYEIAEKDIPGELKAATLFEIGANYDSLGVFDRAAQAFQDVLKKASLQEIKQDARFRYIQMRKKMGLYNEAIREFESMLMDPRNSGLFSRIRLEIAESLNRKGDVRGALLAYEDVIEEFKGNDAAEAYYRMAQIYEAQMGDYERALTQYKQVRTASGRSAFADSADIMSRDIERFKALRLVVDMGLRGEKGQLSVADERVDDDTLDVTRLFARLDTTRLDSARYALVAELRGQAFLDSLIEEAGLSDAQRILPQWRERLEKREAMGGVDWIGWIERGALPTDAEMGEELFYVESHRLKHESQEIIRSEALSSFRVEEVDKNLFLLSELYLFRFDMPDSAAAQYRTIVSGFPESPFVPQALFNLAYISTDIHHDTASADTAYRRIVEDFPDSRFANWSRRWLGLAPRVEPVDSLEQIFRKAEKTLTQDEDPETAYRIYETIFENHPETDWAPKAVYAMGWISEHRLDSLSLAYVLYDSLMKRYPETIYAKQVQPKIQAVIAAEQQKAAEAEKAVSDESKETEDAQLKQPLKVSGGGAPADSLGEDFAPRSRASDPGEARDEETESSHPTHSADEPHPQEPGPPEPISTPDAAEDREESLID